MRRVLLDVAIGRINNISCGRCSVPTKSAVAWIICLLSAPALILIALWLVFMLLLPLGCALVGLLSWRKLMMMQATEQATAPVTAVVVQQAMASDHHLNVQLYDPDSINGRSVKEGNMLHTLFTLSCNSGLIRIVFSVLVFSQLSRFISWVEQKTLQQEQQHRDESAGSSNSCGGYELIANNESELSECNSNSDSELSSILSTEDAQIYNGDAIGESSFMPCKNGNGALCNNNQKQLEIRSETVFWFNPLANMYNSGNSSEVVSDSDTDHEGEGASSCINGLVDAEIKDASDAHADELKELESINEEIRRYWQSLQSVNTVDSDIELDLHVDSNIDELHEGDHYVHNILESNSDNSYAFLQIDPDLDMDIDYELFVYAGGKPCSRDPAELDLLDQWPLTANSSSVHINIDDESANCCGRLSDYRNYNYYSTRSTSPSPAFSASSSTGHSSSSSSSTERSSSTASTPSMSSSWDNWSWIQWHRNHAMFGRSSPRITNINQKYCSDDDSSTSSPSNYKINPAGREMINTSHKPKRESSSLNNQSNRGPRRAPFVNNSSNNNRRSKAAVSKTSFSNGGGALQKVQAQRRAMAVTCRPPPPSPVLDSGRSCCIETSGRISMVPERHLRRLHVPASTTSRSSS